MSGSTIGPRGHPSRRSDVDAIHDDVNHQSKPRRGFRNKKRAIVFRFKKKWSQARCAPDPVTNRICNIVMTINTITSVNGRNWYHKLTYRGRSPSCRIHGSGIFAHKTFHRKCIQQLGFAYHGPVNLPPPLTPISESLKLPFQHGP